MILGGASFGAHRVDDTGSELSPYAPLLSRLHAGDPIADERSRLVDAAVAQTIRPGFEQFQSLGRLRFEPFPYQLAAAQRALARMRGRAILADEVGLGKTIEAALVLSELYVRRLVRRTLVLVPAGLVEQWCEELDRKFALPLLVLGGDAWTRALRPWDAPIVVASLATARRAPWREKIAEIEWDLVIADEAHRLKNPQSASAQLVKAVRTRRLLLLTATPFENRIDDLFQLVNLVRPGLLGTPATFRRRYSAVELGATGDAREALQRSLRDVMVRHRRSEVALMLPRRLAETFSIPPSPDEAALYRAVGDRVREAARGASPAQRFTLRHVQRAAGSSPRALRSGLERQGWTDLVEQADAIAKPRKLDVLLRLIDRYDRTGEKAIVFTAFQATLHMLAGAVAEVGRSAAVYRGDLSRREKIEAIRAFQGETPLLLTTEAAGEGRNLQFCHVLINYDLPWNPMQIEQRLGRVHRIGQTHDVSLTNLVGVGTIEERILRVLEVKINMFELVVGELDMILGRIEDDFDFESFLFRNYVEALDDEDFGVRVDQFGEELARARSDYLESRATVDCLVPVDPAS
jgi:SNF2 family DNA or RNA helicase